MSDFRTELSSLDGRILELQRDRKKLIIEKVKVCKHEYVYAKSQHPDTKSNYVCKECNLGIPVGHVGKFNSPVLSIKDSDVIVGSKIPSQLYHVNEVVCDALRFPSRFEENYINELLEDTPFDVNEVLEKDTKHYSILTDLYNNYDDWRKANIRDD